MKLWQKEGINVAKNIERYTIGLDADFDLELAPYDVLGSMAHATMLTEVGLLEKEELSLLLKELKVIYKDTINQTFVIDDGVEDVHSQVEFNLTQKLGDVGKKVHSGRSRNDQVLVDLKLYLRAEIKTLVEKTAQLFDVLQSQSERYKDVLLPGYTHFQVAMPSSFGLWFGAYAEALCDDLNMLKTAYELSNKNPLGSAAGYGSSFPLNRKRTTALLGFKEPAWNVVYAQMGRGKTELFAAYALAALGQTIAKMAMDVCLYMSQNFGFVTLPSHLTTGSSIMPHKKNPDVFEIMRGKCNRMMDLPNRISMLISNLPSGYHRELQLMKEDLFPALKDMGDTLDMAAFMMAELEVNTDILKDDKYTYLFTVEEVNKLVLAGVPFRDAYKQIGDMVEKGAFKASKEVNHSSEGSIGNLCNDEIKAQFDGIKAQFHFDKVEKAIDDLLETA